MKEKIIVAILIVLPLVLCASIFVPVHASPTATMYVTPSSIDDTLHVGSTFTVTIMFKDFVDLWSFHVQIKWDPAIIDCTAFRFSTTLATDVFGILCPGRLTMAIKGNIDHVTGNLWCKISLSVPPTTGVTGVAGTGYKLVEMDCTVVSQGTCTIEFDNPPPSPWSQGTGWSNSSLTEQPCNFQSATVVPEFPEALILPILMTSTLFAALLGKTLLSKKQRGRSIAK